MKRDNRQLEVAKDVVVKLEKWGAYIYHEATTGSIYIKFPHWGLGSIRIGDHPGKQKYRYRWRIRADVPKSYFRIFKDRHIWVTEASYEKVDSLIYSFETAAAERKIAPGSVEKWEDRDALPAR